MRDDFSRRAFASEIPLVANLGSTGEFQEPD